MSGMETLVNLYGASGYMRASPLFINISTGLDRNLDIHQAPKCVHTLSFVLIGKEECITFVRHTKGVLSINRIPG